MSNITVYLNETPVHAEYIRKGKIIKVIQPHNADGYAVFENQTLVYITKDFDCLTAWIMEDLGLVD